MDQASHENWDQLIKDWKSSGKSINQFCQSKKIPVHKFYYHRHQRNKKFKTGDFTKIKLPSELSKPIGRSINFTIKFPNGAILDLGTCSIAELKEILR